MTSALFAAAVLAAAFALACGWTVRLDAWARRQRVAARRSVAVVRELEHAEAEADAREDAEDAVRRLRRRLAVAEARWAALAPERAREDGVRVIRVVR